MTLEELAAKHGTRCDDVCNDFLINLYDLRALIEEAVGIVQGEQYSLSRLYVCSNDDGTETWKVIPLHNNDLGRIK